MNCSRVCLRLSKDLLFSTTRCRLNALSISSVLKSKTFQPNISLATPSIHKRFYTQKIEKTTNFNVQDDDEFNSRVLYAKIPIIVDFHAQWCAPCKMLGPRLEREVDKHGGKVMLAKVDVDDFADVAIKHKIRAVPTIMLFKNGESVEKFEGNVEDDELENFVKKALKE